MIKREQHWNIVLNQYLRERKLYCYYELKQIGNKNIFSFKNIERVQWDGLQSANKSGFVWKMSDEISRPKPFDGMCTPPLPAYLVIKFKTSFCLISIDKIVTLRDEGAISISEEKAMEIADKIIKLK